MNTIMKDCYGNELNVTLLVVARTTLSTTVCDYLTAGNVYPAGYLLNGELVVLDDDTEVLPVDWADVSNITDSDTWCRVEAAYNKAGFSCGDIVPVKESIKGRNLTTGCVWCLNQSGCWIALPESKLTKIKVHMTAQALTARMKSATEQGTSQVLVVNLNGGAGAGGSGTVSVGSSISFTPAPEKLDNVVRVEFQSGGKLYTYRLKDGMIAFPGDDAVVVVNNPDHPELKGTKVVRVKEVDRQENLGGSYKYVEHVVSNEAERKAQYEAARKRAIKKLDDKFAELEKAKAKVTRLSSEFDKMSQDLANNKF